MNKKTLTFLILQLFFAVFLLSQGLEVKKQRLSNLKEKIIETEKNLEKTEEKKQREENKFQEFRNKLEYTNKSINRLKRNEQLTFTEIRNKEKEIVDRRKKISYLKSSINQQFTKLLIEDTKKNTDDSHIISNSIKQCHQTIVSIMTEKEHLAEIKHKKENEFKVITDKKKREIQKNQNYQQKLKKTETHINVLKQEQKEFNLVYNQLKNEAKALENLLSKLEISDQNNKFSFKFSNEILNLPADGKIIRTFGEYQDKNYNITRLCKGIDIKTKHDTQIRAVDNGIVIFSEWFKGAGKLLIIDHKNGFHTLYSHNSKLLVTKGEEVYKDQIIAVAGNTGSTDVNKLHFEIRKQGIPVDPAGFFNLTLSE